MVIGITTTAPVQGAIDTFKDLGAGTGRYEVVYDPVTGTSYSNGAPLSLGGAAARPSIAFFGSSTTARCIAANGKTLSSYGYAGWFQALTKNRFSIYEVSGVIGEYGDAQLTRLLAKLAVWAANPPAGIVLQLGANDAGAGILASDTMARINTAIAATKKIGAVPIIFPPPPRADLDGPKTAEVVKTVQAIYALGSADTNIIVADVPRYAGLAAAAGSSYVAKTGAQASDTIHLSVSGCAYAGLALREATDRWLRSASLVDVHPGDFWVNSTLPNGNLLATNNLLQTVDGVGVPGGWASTGINIDKVNSIYVKRSQYDADSYYRMRVNLVAGNQFFVYQDTPVISNAGNNQFQSLVEIVVDTTAAPGVVKNIGTRFRNTDSTALFFNFYSDLPDADCIWPTGVFDMVQVMPAVPIDTKNAAMRFAFVIEATGTGVVDLYLRFARANNGSVP